MEGMDEAVNDRHGGFFHQRSNGFTVIGAMQSCHPRGQIISFTQYDLGTILPLIPRRTWTTAKIRSVGHFVSSDNLA